MPQKKKKLTKLERLMAETNPRSETGDKYETTLRDCRKWMNILNEEIFGGKLPKIKDIDIRRRRNCYAYYLYYPVSKGDDFRYYKLCMKNNYPSKQFFVEILAHELIHHYQYINGQPLGHGPSFMAWKESFNKKGIKLVKVYVEKPKKPKRGHKKLK